MVACLGRATTPLLLAAITMGWLGDGRGVGLIYASVAVTGMVRAFLGPVYNALFARVLPREQFANGASLGSIVFQAGLVVGPAIGGVLVGRAGRHVAYLKAAVFAVAASMAVAWLQIGRAAVRERVWTSVVF